jgi:hypothetical protein
MSQVNRILLLNKKYRADFKESPQAGYLGSSKADEDVMLAELLSQLSNSHAMQIPLQAETKRSHTCARN